MRGLLREERTESVKKLQQKTRAGTEKLSFLHTPSILFFVSYSVYACCHRRSIVVENFASPWGRKSRTNMTMAAGARVGSRLLQAARSSALLPAAKPSNLTAKRTFAADHGHGPARVNIWEDPTSPSKWKEEQFVFVSLAGWGVIFYSGYQAMSGFKNKSSKLEA